MVSQNLGCLSFTCWFSEFSELFNLPVGFATIFENTFVLPFDFVFKSSSSFFSFFDDGVFFNLEVLFFEGEYFLLERFVLLLNHVDFGINDDIGQEEFFNYVLVISGFLH